MISLRTGLAYTVRPYLRDKVSLGNLNTEGSFQKENEEVWLLANSFCTWLYALG